MIVLDILSRRSDYRLRFLQVDLRIIIFDEAVIAYARDEILSGEVEWDAELKKYENQLKLDDDNVSHHRDSPADSWVFYIELWARADYLNHVHKIYGHCSNTILFDIIRVRQW